MISARKEMVSKISPLFDGRFKYGSYKSQPKLPYANYGRNISNNMIADDKVYVKINSYTVRVVTEHKDFEIEEQIEDIFDELEIPYQVMTDEELEKEKVHCTEWEICIVEWQ